jgi:hypothetical protein
MMSITDDRAQRVFVLEVAGLTTRYTSHPIDPSASNMDSEVADGINYVNRASIIDVGAFAGSIDPSGGIAQYSSLSVTLASDRVRGDEHDPAVIFGRCGARASDVFHAQLVGSVPYEDDTGIIRIDVDARGQLTYPRIMHMGAESFRVSALSQTTGRVFTYTARAVGGSQRQEHRQSDWGSNVPEISSAITTFRGRRARLWIGQQYAGGGLSDFVEVMNGFIESSPIVEQGGEVTLSLLPISALIDTTIADKVSKSTKLVQDFHYFNGFRASWLEWALMIKGGGPEYWIDRSTLDPVAGTFEYFRTQAHLLEMYDPALNDGYDLGLDKAHPRYPRLQGDEVTVYPTNSGTVYGTYDTTKSSSLSATVDQEFYQLRTNTEPEVKQIRLGLGEVKPWPSVIRTELEANAATNEQGGEGAWANWTLRRDSVVEVTPTVNPRGVKPQLVLTSGTLRRVEIDGSTYEPKRWAYDTNTQWPVDPLRRYLRLWYPIDLRPPAERVRPPAERRSYTRVIDLPENRDALSRSVEIGGVARAFYQKQELTILVEDPIGLPTVSTGTLYDIQVRYTSSSGEARTQWLKATHQTSTSYEGSVIGYIIHLAPGQDWSEVESFGDWDGLDAERCEIFGGARFNRESPSEVLLKLLESGGGYQKNGDYDLYSVGLGISSADIDEQSFLSYGSVSPFLFTGEISGEGVNMRDVLEDILKLMGCALVMARSSTGKSLLTLRPMGLEIASDVSATIEAGDWLSDQPPTWSIYEDIVTQVKARWNWSIDEQKFITEATFNNQEAINRYGGESAKIELDLYALTSRDLGGAVGDVTGAFLPVMARLWRLLSNPIRAWRGAVGTGKSMTLDVGSYVSVSSPLLKGYGDAYGVSGEVGMVRSIRQDLMREGAELELIALGVKPVRWNASARVASYTSNSVAIYGDDYTADATDVSFFNVGDVVDYLPEGDEDNAITGLVIESIFANILFFTSAHGITSAGGTIEPTIYTSASASHKADAYLASNTSPPVLGSSTEAQEYA